MTDNGTPSQDPMETILESLHIPVSIEKMDEAAGLVRLQEEYRENQKRRGEGDN